MAILLQPETENQRMEVLHTAIDVANIGQMADFYETLLGLEKHREFEVEGHYNYVVGGEGSAELQFREVDEQPDPAGIDHIAIAIEDVDAVVEEAVSTWESTVEMNPTTVEEGFRLAYITDPEGYSLELIEA